MVRGVELSVPGRIPTVQSMTLPHPIWHPQQSNIWEGGGGPVGLDSIVKSKETG